MKTYYIYLTKRYAIEGSISLRDGETPIGKVYIKEGEDFNIFQKTINLMQNAVDETLLQLDDDRLGLCESPKCDKDIN